MSELLYDRSERQMRRRAAATGRYTENFVDDGDGCRIIGMVDTTPLERWCYEQRRNAPDLKVNRNKTSGKLLHAARIYSWMVEDAYNVNWHLLPRAEKDKLIKRYLSEHPEFTVQKRSTLGL